MKLMITDQVFALNLGHGWTDNNAAADALAGWLAGQYEQEALEAFPDAEVVTDIDVQHDREGSRFEVEVWADDDPDGRSLELRDRLRAVDYWSKWCRTEESRKFLKE